MKNILKQIAVVGLIWLLLDGIISAQPAGYNFRKKLAINNTLVSGTQNLINFVTLVSDTIPELKSISNGGYVHNPSGYDIIFTTADGSTLLDFELEKYTAATGELIAWLKIPSLSYNTDTEFYIYYGNPSIFTDQSSESTWNTNYLAVWHFNNDILDATSNNRDLTNNGSIASGNGKIGGAREFAGTGDDVNDPNGANYLNGFTKFTISAWIKADVIGTDRGFFYGRKPNGYDNRLMIRHDAAGESGGETNVFRCANRVYGTENRTQRLESSSMAQTTNWQHIALTWKSGKKFKFYIDGVLDVPTKNTKARSGVTNQHKTLYIGKSSKGGSTFSWDGLIDEFRIDTVARSANWIASQYASENSPPNFISILNVNDTPVLADIETIALSYQQGDGAVDITSAITVFDYNDPQMVSANIQLTGNYQLGEDTLVFADAYGITGSWVGATGTLTVTGSASLANYESALRSVTYENLAGSPSTLTRTVSFTVNDGTTNSNVVTRDITVGAVNQAPTISSIEGAVLNYIDGDDPTPMTATLAVSDVDDAYLDTAFIQITTNYANGEDVLGHTYANGISGSWAPGTGTMTLTGNASLANYQIALRSVTYDNLNPDPSELTRTVSFKVNDGALNSNTLTRDISVTKANDKPILADIDSTALNYAAGSGPVTITSLITATDYDNTNLDSAIIHITNNYDSNEDILSFNDIYGIAGNWNSTAGRLTLTGTTTVSDYQAALRTVKYENTSASPTTPTRVVSFIASDGLAKSDTISRLISTTVPGTIANLELWLKADVGTYKNGAGTNPAIIDGDGVRFWGDQSGYGRDFKSTVDAKPILRTNVVELNNATAIEFLGTGDRYLDGDGELYINGMTEFTIFFTVKSDITGSDKGLFLLRNPNGNERDISIRYDATGDIGGGSDIIKAGILSGPALEQIESIPDIQSTNGQVICLDWESGSVYKLYADGVLVSSQATPPTGTISTATKVFIGLGSQDASGTSSWDGLIGEVILYSRHLPESERNDIEDYLSEKFGIPMRMITRATGGESLSVDDVGGNYTTLSGPRIREGYLGEFTAGGTIILTAPSGFEWNTGVTPGVTVDAAYGSATSLTASFTSITSTNITYTINAASTGPNQPGALAFTNLEVRPTTSTMPNSGNITNGGTTGPSGSANLGTLTMVAGVKTKLDYTRQPVNSTAGNPISPAVEVQIYDAHNNPVSEENVTIAITLSNGTGVLSGTTSLMTNPDGNVSFVDMSINLTGTNKVLTASSTGLTSIVSNTFSITVLGAFTTFRLERESGGNILTQTAGQPFTMKISAVDGTGTVDANFTGTVDITSTGILSLGSGTTTNFVAGILASHALTVSNTGNFTITATNSSGSENGVSNSFTVNPGVADATTSQITASPTVIVNNGASTSTITAQLKDSQGNNLTTGGDAVNFLTDAGTLLSTVTNNADGTYTQTLQSTTTAQTATVTAVINGQNSTDNAQVSFTAVTSTWQSSVGTGSQPTEWNLATNWSSGSIPTTSDAVLIPATPANGVQYPIVSINNQTVGSIIVEAGADVTISGSINFIVDNDVSGPGEINGGTGDTLQIGGDCSISNLALPTILLNGSLAQTISNPFTYQNLILDNPTWAAFINNLTVTGTLTLTNGMLSMNSGTSLIANTKSIGAGSLKFDREIIGSQGWRLLAAPVNSTYGDFFDSLFTQGYTGSDSVNGSPSILYYDETYTGTDNQRWRKPSNITDATLAGRGHFVYVFGNIIGEPAYSNPLPLTLDITGQEEEGVANEFDFSVTYTAAGDTGWNLIGNPFGATVNWDHAGWTKTNMDQAIYIWDQTINSGNGGYLTWNGVAGSHGNGLIPPFQGFWVKANAASPVLKVNKSAKTYGGVFYKKATNLSPIIMFQVEYDSLEATTHIMFSPDASTGKDPWDAYRLIPPSQTFMDIYTLSPQGTQLSVNNYPLAFGIPIEIDLDLQAFINDASMTGTYTLYWPKMENLPNLWTLTLIDRNLNNHTDLKENDQYTFDYYSMKTAPVESVNPNKILPGQILKMMRKQANGSARFALRINPGNNPDIPDHYSLGYNYPNPFNIATTIRFMLPLQSKVYIEIFDITGRQVDTVISKIYQAGYHEIVWRPYGFGTGIYFCRFKAGGHQFTQKISLIK